MKGEFLNVSENEENIDELKVNDKFKKKYEHLEKVKLVQKAAEKGYLEEDDESYSSEDSQGVLINAKVTDKFMETYLALRDKNKAKELINSDKTVFEDEDFDLKVSQHSEKPNLTVQDTLTMKSEDITDINYKPSNSKSTAGKSEFLKSANTVDDDEFLQKKENLDDSFESLSSVEHKDKETLLSKKRKIKGVKTETLDKFYGDEDLDKNERFLRNYIIGEGWLEKNSSLAYDFKAEHDSEQEDEKHDKFESKVNFRFEEDGGANITTFSREQASSVRKKENTRKEKRQRLQERQRDEAERRRKEIAAIQEIKKEEMKNKILALEKAAGTDKIKEYLAELEEETDMTRFDDKMNKIFDSEYNRQMEFEETIKEDIPEKGFDYKTNADLLTEDKVKAFEEGEEGENEWWYCDNCKKVIKPGNLRFEAEELEDFVLCRKCYKSTEHEVKFKKFKVPVGSEPPEGYEEIIANCAIECGGCEKELTTLKEFFKEEESGVSFCRKCRKKKEGTFIKVSNVVEGEKDKSLAEQLDEVLEATYKKEVDVKNKVQPSYFKYVNVEKEDFGIEDEELLYLDDRSLNKYVPLKKLAPYKKGDKFNKFVAKDKLKSLKKEAAMKKRNAVRNSDEPKTNKKVKVDEDRAKTYDL